MNQFKILSYFYPKRKKQRKNSYIQSRNIYKSTDKVVNKPNNNHIAQIRTNKIVVNKQCNEDFDYKNNQSNHKKTVVKPQKPHKRSEEHTSELQSRPHLVCRLLLE